MKRVKISVLMPAYNAANFIGDAISSVLNQSFKEFELIVINDGSSDETEKIIRSFDDNRIVLINQENTGLAQALNNGLQLAKADYIARFDADDICHPKRLEKQYSFLTINTGYIIVGSAVEYVDEFLNYIFTYYPPKTNSDIQSSKKSICPFIHSSVLYRKDIILKYGYNVHAHSFEDHLLWMNVLKEGKAYNLQEPFLKVRLNPQSITIDERWRPKKFHTIKNNVLLHQAITVSQGEELLHILKRQNRKVIKEGAYFSLLTKKYLWNNYQPQKARQNLRKLAGTNIFNWRIYFLFLLSFCPQKLLHRSYKILKTK